MENWSDLVRINMDWINHVQERWWMFEVAFQMSLLQNMQTRPGFDFHGGLSDGRGNDIAVRILSHQVPVSL